MNSEALILKLSCPDAVGLLARVTGFIAERGGNLVDVHQYTDAASGWFFARLAFSPGDLDRDVYARDFSDHAAAMSAAWTLRAESEPTRTAILVSREDHALREMLWRRECGELNIEIPLVIGNHDHLREITERSGLAFRHIPVSADGREAAFRAIHDACVEANVGLIVLARFMQILPNWFCAAFPNRIINIHHSFLPAFAGADPYRRAFERGVKLIGATCHYATAQLDEGPIIEQEVVRVEHFHDLADLKRHGRDCERLALARGVRFHVEDRVLPHGPRTVVFRD